LGLGDLVSLYFLRLKKRDIGEKEKRMVTGGGGGGRKKKGRSFDGCGAGEDSLSSPPERQGRRKKREVAVARLVRIEEGKKRRGEGGSAYTLW